MEWLGTDGDEWGWWGMDGGGTWVAGEQRAGGGEQGGHGVARGKAEGSEERERTVDNKEMAAVGGQAAGLDEATYGQGGVADIHGPVARIRNDRVGVEVEHDQLMGSGHGDVKPLFDQGQISWV